MATIGIPLVSRFKGSAFRTSYIKPREYTVIADEDGQPLLVCSRICSLTNGVVRDGVTLTDIVGNQDGLTVQTCILAGFWSDCCKSFHSSILLGGVTQWDS